MLSRFRHAAVTQFRASVTDIDDGTLLEVRVRAQRTAEGRLLILCSPFPRLLRLHLLLRLILLQLLLLLCQRLAPLLLLELPLLLLILLTLLLLYLLPNLDLALTGADTVLFVVVGRERRGGDALGAEVV